MNESSISCAIVPSKACAEHPEEFQEFQPSSIGIKSKNYRNVSGVAWQSLGNLSVHPRRRQTLEQIDVNVLECFHEGRLPCQLISLAWESLDRQDRELLDEKLPAKPVDAMASIACD